MRLKKYTKQQAEANTKAKLKFIQLVCHGRTRCRKCPFWNTNVCMNENASAREFEKAIERMNEMMKDKEKQKEYIKKYTERLKAEHKCVKCREPLPEGDTHTTCEKCRLKMHNRYKKKGKTETTETVEQVETIIDEIAEHSVAEVVAEGNAENVAEQTTPTIKDSGNRREFDTGAVRDMGEGKGRFDLMPLDVVASVLNCSNRYVENDIPNYEAMAEIFKLIESFKKIGFYGHLQEAAALLLAIHESPYNAILELSKHFENGALKYGENNWQKGLPTNCYIDSACRHLTKYMADWNDEPHYIACLWNLVCCIWTCENKPECNVYRKVSKGGD